MSGVNCSINRRRAWASCTNAEQCIAARLASLVCPTYSAPPTHRLQHRKRVRRQGLTLRVTRRFFRGHDAEANANFCHARVVYSIGQERRATAMRTFSAKAPASLNRACQQSQVDESIRTPVDRSLT
jgi:hypothetical protein